MKKLLSAVLFLLPTLAMAIDKPIPCSGNSCKLLFETTGSGGAKVSAGEASGLGVWKLGPTDASTSAAVHEIRNGNGANTNGTNTLLVQTGNQGAHATRLKIQNSTGGTADIYETTVGAGVTTFRNGAGTVLGTVDNTNANATMTGRLSVSSALEFGDTSESTRFGFYFSVVNPAATTTCESQCAANDATNGFGGSSGHCLLALHAAQTLSTCADATNEVKYCACMGLN